MDDEKISVTRILLSILILLTFASVVFLVIAGLTWVICWGFDKVWSWKVAIGSTVFMYLVVTTLRIGRSK